MVNFIRRWFPCPAHAYLYIWVQRVCSCLLSPLKLSFGLASSAWFLSAVEGIWTFPARCQQYPGTQKQILQASCSQMPLGLLAAQVTSGSTQWNFQSFKLLHPAATHVVLTAVVSKHIPNCDLKEQRHPSKTLRRNSCPIVSLIFSTIPKGKDGSVGRMLRCHSPTHWLLLGWSAADVAGVQSLSFVGEFLLWVFIKF